jgi:sulfatase maturation enzyme AslB (radical SAM superfamily)
MPVFRKSRYTVAVPLDTNLDTNTERMAAIYQTMTEAFILIPESAWSHLNNGSSAGVDSSTVDMLCENGILVKEGVNETALFKAWMQQHVHDFSTIRSKVLVTRRCNNQCTYCILDPKPKDMSRNTALAMDRFYLEIIKEKNPHKVQDDFLGGEPLLNPGIILESAARRYFYCMGRGIEYGFTITTNGTLLKPSMIINRKPGKGDIRLMISPQEVHVWLIFVPVLYLMWTATVFPVLHSAIVR